MKRHIIIPPYVSLDGYNYTTSYGNYGTYSWYNYLRPGISSKIKRRHFELCLAIAEKYFTQVNVIDFGCADGFFIPSLSKYFNSVIAIDINPIFTHIAEKIVSKLELKNVDVICNKDLTTEKIATKISGKRYHILFVLEVLEHIGEKPTDMYDSKVNFLRDISTLIDDEGIIVISVPKMVGITFLIQRIGLTIFRMQRDPVSTKDLIMASIFSDTKNLEKSWNGQHVGFNHKIMEKKIINHFDILEKKHDLFQIIYVIRKRSTNHV